jgi:hypothetical protein
VRPLIRRLRRHLLPQGEKGLEKTPVQRHGLDAADLVDGGADVGAGDQGLAAFEGVGVRPLGVADGDGAWPAGGDGGRSSDIGVGEARAGAALIVNVAAPKSAATLPVLPTMKPTRTPFCRP